MRANIRWPWLGLAFALAVSGCREKTPAPRPPERVTIDAENVAVVQEELIETGPRVSGSLEAANRAVIRAEVSGTVLAVRAEQGQAVRRGQVLVRIEADALEEAVASARAALATARAQYNTAQTNLRRIRRLVKAGALAQTELESTEDARSAMRAQLAQARTVLTQAQDRLSDTTVRAPIDGVVSERAVGAGDVVAPGAALFTIIDPGSLRLQAGVPSEALPHLQVGTPVSFEVRGHPRRTFKGTITRIAPAADAQTRQIPILVTLPNPRGDLLAGLFAEGRVLARTRRSLVVPLAAVDQSGPTETVLRIEDGKVRTVAVKTGIIDERDELIEITQGLQPGDRVIVGAARDVAPGTAVRVAQPAAAMNR